MRKLIFKKASSVWREGFCPLLPAFSLCRLGLARWLSVFPELLTAGQIWRVAVVRSGYQNYPSRRRCPRHCLRRNRLLPGLRRKASQTKKPEKLYLFYKICYIFIFLEFTRLSRTDINASDDIFSWEFSKAHLIYT